MKLQRSTARAVAAILLAAGLSLLGCGLFAPSARPSEVVDVTGASEASAGPAGTAEPTLRVPITRLLELRSVAIVLESSSAEGGTVKVMADVDAAGNYHMTRITRGELPADFPPSAQEPPQAMELYVVSGEVYGPDESGALVKAESSGLASSLEGSLRGFFGPGMWLLALPKGSLTAGEAEARGGFQASVSDIQGNIEGATITGSIWVDQASGALIGADLQIPGDLLGLPGKPAPAPMTISLQVASADIAPIAPPGVDISQAAATPSVPGATSETGGGFDLSQAGLPPDFPVYPGASSFSGIPGTMVMYTVDADVRTASAFYDEELKADGWSGFSTGGGSVGECGGDCGPVPTKTPGPAPTGTPVGWMRDNVQMWTSGDKQVVISYSANSSGGTDISIVLAAQ